MASPPLTAVPGRRTGRAAGLWILALAALFGVALALIIAFPVAGTHRGHAPDLGIPDPGDDASPEDWLAFATSRPELFDPLQPVRDTALLVAPASENDLIWQQQIDAYRRVVLDPEPVRSTLVEKMRLDYLGRRDIARAWDIARRVRRELTELMRQTHTRGIEKRLDNYDLVGARRLLLAEGRAFENTVQWLENLRDLGEAVELERRGLDRLQRSIEIDGSPFYPTHLTLAYIDLARGQPDRARARCEALLETEPPPPPAAEDRIRYCLARALEHSDLPDRAVAQVRHILDRSPGRLEPQLRLAELYLQSGRHIDANTVADNILAARPESARASYVKGLTALRLGRLSEAVDHLDRAHRHFPEDNAVLFHLALAENRSGQHMSAFQSFSKVANAGYQPPWSRLAAVASALGHRREAPQAADTARNVWNWLNRAEGGLATEEEHRVVAEYALRFWAASAVWQMDYGVIRETASSLLRAAVDRQRAYYVVAGIVAARGYTAENAPLNIPSTELKLLQEQSEQDAAAKYCLAFLVAIADRQEARNILEELVDEHPDYTLARLHLARLCLLDGQTERAARILEGADLASSLSARRALQFVRKLQGQPPCPVRPSPAAGPSDYIIGPHLLFFDNAAYEDPISFARLIVLLDPDHPAGEAILESAYSHVRRHGLKGIRKAADEDPYIDRSIRQAVGSYTTGPATYQLIVGRFWDELPMPPMTGNSQ